MMQCKEEKDQKKTMFRAAEAPQHMPTWAKHPIAKQASHPKMFLLLVIA